MKNTIKKLVTASLFVFWALVVSVGTAALIRYDSNKSGVLMGNSSVIPVAGTTQTASKSPVTTVKTTKPTTSTTAKPTSNTTVKVIPTSSVPTSNNSPASTQNQAVPVPVPANNPGIGTALTSAVVATHGSVNDCWVIVEGNVYNLTSFLNQHSGGAGAIIPYCGKDGTNAFITKDQNPANSHRSGDLAILNTYSVGALNQTVSSATLQQAAVQNATPAQTTPSGGSRGGDDD